MSVSSISTGPRNYRRSPSSILSSDSDIRFTRKKLTSQYRCGCCIIAIFLLLLLFGSVIVYVTYIRGSFEKVTQLVGSFSTLDTYFMPDDYPEQIFRTTFRIVEGDTFSSELADPNSTEFKNRSRNYQERLNLLFKRSSISRGFSQANVLAFDGTEDKDLIVHFNVHIDSNYVIVQSKDLENIISKEISFRQSRYFQNLTIDHDSLEVRPIDSVPEVTPTFSPTAIHQVVTEAVTPPRKCSSLQLSYCSKLSYNITTYPNILGHRNGKEVNDDVISFRELVDAECYRHAYEFVCHVLQPKCVKREEEKVMMLPCRKFCRDFMAGCSGRLSDKFKNVLDCSKFPELSDETPCITKPGCVEELQSRALSPRICDGVIDCQDLSDEKSCTYCGKNRMHCGIGRMCIRERQRCDGKKDCPDGGDERDCLSLTPSIKDTRQLKVMTPHLARYHSEGFVTFNEKGEIGKVCTENLNHTTQINQTTKILHTVASSLCKALSFKNVLTVQVETDFESDISYVSMRDPLASEISFERSVCPSKQVLKVSCSDLACGIQRTNENSDSPTLSKISVHGEWPWHVSLLKEDVHICDGTLISPQWVVTSTSCFQGQAKAKWTAHLGIIRLSSSSPWEQERRIIGMVKSPVEGSTIALVKLDEEVMFNDFVRPICLPDDTLQVNPGSNLECNTLGWTRNREQLQRVQVKLTGMEKCENISISTLNSLCTETYYGKNDCSEEEFAGSSMACLSHSPLQQTWVLVGITNWRIACAQDRMERPRMYDNIVPNVNWIRNTINGVNDSK